MKSKRVQALVLAAALAAGYGGAAAWTALAAPSLAVVTDFGPGDGLTRYVVSAAAGSPVDDLVTGLDAVDGVVSAQVLSDGRALVATDALTPRDLSAVEGVGAVEPSPTVPLLADVTDPLFRGYGWHLENTGSNAVNQTPVLADADVDAGTGWDTSRGEGIVVAVVDSGFDSDHPDLVGSLWVNPAEPCGSVDTDGNGKRGDCHGWNWYSDSPDIDNGAYGSHGAMVSGTVGARADNGIGLAGVAPGVTIMPLVIGGGSTVDVFAGAEAIRYAVDHGADVINASWGGGVSGSALTALRSAVAYAAANDVLVVAAAGNDSGDRDTNPVYPASLPDWNVITVGASTAADTISGFSGYGATAVDLFAPGTQVVVTSNTGGYALVNGTSFSSPIVAGAVALHRAARPEATAAELKQALLDDVDPGAAFLGRSVTGGRLSLGRLTGTPAESVRYAFTSMTAPAGTVSPRIGVSGSAAAGHYSVALGLGMEHEGEIWALADKPVTLDGATVPTDDTGSAVFDLGALDGLDGLGLSPTVPLGDGRYVLTAQLLRDGEPVGRTSAAPLLVRTSLPGPGGGDTAPGTTPGTAPGATPGTTTPGTTTPGTTTPGTTPGDTGAGTGPQPGTRSPSTPGGPTAGSGGTPAPTTPGAPSTPGTPAPGTPAPGTPTPGTPGTAPGDPAPAPGTGGGGTTPSAPAPSTPAPSAPAPSTPAPWIPAPSTPAPSTPAPSTPGDDTTTYPSVGAFGITSLSPDTVSVDGGTLVTVTGTALPARPQILIGGTARAVVVTESATRVQFRVPARTAGVYDVTVFAPDGRSTVLAGGLTYRAAVPPTEGTPGTGTTPPGGDTTPGTTAPTTPAPGPGTRGSESGPVVRTGPSGERLVRSATFSALRGIWSVDCASSCTGVVI